MGRGLDPGRLGSVMEQARQMTVRESLREACVGLVLLGRGHDHQQAFGRDDGGVAAVMWLDVEEALRRERCDSRGWWRECVDKVVPPPWREAETERNRR